MATNTTPRLLVELSPHSLQLALIQAGGRLAGYKTCAAEAAAVTSVLGELPPAAKAAAVHALVVPHAGFVLRSSAEEAAAMRTPKTLIARAETAGAALGSPLNVVAFDSATGQRVDTVGSSPWVLAGTSAARIEAAEAQLASLGLKPESVRLALPVRIGAVVTALQDMPESTRVVVWQVGESNGELVCVSAGGCEAATDVAAGFTQIFEAVQGGLGLKFKAAAAKLFFNSDYDFSETAGPIAERLAATLRPAIAAMGCKPTTFHVAGLPSGQAWLAKAVASALDLVPLAPDMAAFCAQRGLGGSASEGDLPASALGLLLQASNVDQSAWQPTWLDASAPVVIPAPAPAPAPKAPEPAPKAPAAPAPAAPEPVAVAAAAAPAAPSKDKKPVPAAKPAAPVAKPAAPAPEPSPVATPAPMPVVKKPAPTPALAQVVRPKPAPEPVSVASVQPVEQPEPVQGAVVAAPAVAPAKKKTGMLVAVIGAVVVLGGAGAFFAMKSGGASGEASAAKLTPEQIALQEAQRARWLEEEMKNPRSFRNERYSFEVSERGYLEKLVGAGNRTIVDQVGWIDLQGTFTGSVRTFNAGSMSDPEYRATVKKSIRGDNVVFEISGSHPKFTFETLVTCLPRSIVVRTEFKPVRFDDSRGPVSGVYTTIMNRPSLTLGQRATINGGAVTYSTLAGPMTLKFNDDIWGQAGEAGKQTMTAGSHLVFFYFTGAAGAKNVLQTEIALP